MINSVAELIEKHKGGDVIASAALVEALCYRIERLKEKLLAQSSCPICQLKFLPGGKCEGCGREWFIGVTDELQSKPREVSIGLIEEGAKLSDVIKPIRETHRTTTTNPYTSGEGGTT